MAIGFAFRDILQNFLSGLLILLTEPFRIGDQIIFGEYEGTVEDIQTRATYLKTYDGRRVVIPNADLFINSVIVNTAFATRRLQYDIGISYGDDVERARQVIFEVLRSTDGVLQDPKPEVFMVDFGESSVNLRVMWWIAPPRRLETLAASSYGPRLLRNFIEESRQPGGVGPVCCRVLTLLARAALDQRC